MKKFLTFSLLSMLVFVGCGKSTPTIVDNAKTSTETAMIKVPKGCPQKTNLEVKSAEAGDVVFTSQNSIYLYHSTDWGTLYFVNYPDFDTRNPLSHSYSEKDVTAYFDLKTKDHSAIKVGIWNYRKLGENNDLSWLNISTQKLSGGVFDDKGKVELTYAGKDYVCGKVISKDTSSSLNGEFIAKFSK